MKITKAKILLIITFLLESTLAIPFVGTMIVYDFFFIPLIVMFVLHSISLFVCAKAKMPVYGNASGVLASCIGWFPILGWALHLTAVIALLLNILHDKKYEGQESRV